MVQQTTTTCRRLTDQWFLTETLPLLQKESIPKKEKQGLGKKIQFVFVLKKPGIHEAFYKQALKIIQPRWT